MSLDRSVRPPAGPPRRVSLPRLELFSMDNGMECQVGRRPGIPEVAVRLVLEAGAGAEAPERSGLAALASRLLRSGGDGLDVMEVARWQDRLGTGFSATAGYGVATVSMHFLPEVLSDALDFLVHVVRRPDFPEDEVTRLRDERLDEIARENDHPALVATRAFARELYQEGLYGRPIRGSKETVEGLTREDIVSFHNSRYGPVGAWLTASGDVDPDHFQAEVEARFGSWSGGEARVPAPVSPHPTGTGPLVVHRPGSAQAELRVGTVGVPYGTEDHHAIVVANAILGGMFNSRINLNLREEKGWTYGARSDFRFRRGAGPFVVRTAVETGVAGDAFQEILSEIRRMREEQVTGDELRLAKNSLTRSLPLRFETAPQIVSRASHMRTFDLPSDYWESYAQDIEAVTPEAVREVCRTYLDSERLTLLAVTDAEVAESSFSGFESVTVRSWGAPAGGDGVH